MRVVGLLVVLLVARAATAQRFADYLPAKTTIYVSLENLSRTRDRAGKNALGALWRAPEMQVVRAELDRLGAASGEGADGVGALARALDGQLCLAVIRVGETDTSTVVMIDCKGARQLVLDVIGRLRRHGDAEEREETGEFRGYKLSTWRTMTDAAEPETSYAVMKDDFLAFGADLDVLKDIVARREMDEKTGLGSTAAYRTVAAATGERPDIRFFFSSAQWRDGLAVPGAAILAAAGFEGVNGIGGQLTLAPDGASVRLLVQHDGKARGLLALLGKNVDALAPSPLLPTDTSQCVALALDWQRLHDVALGVLAAMDAATLRELKMFIEGAERELGLRFRDDLLAALEPGLTIYLQGAANEGQTGKVSIPVADMSRMYVVIQPLRDKQPIEKLLAKLSERDLPLLKPTDYLGTTLYRATWNILPHAAIIGENLVVTPVFENLQELVRRHGKELANIRDSEAFKRAVTVVPARRSLLLVHDAHAADDAWPLALRLRRNSPDDLGYAFLRAFPGQDFFARYENLMAVALSAEENGLLLTALFGLRAPAAEERDE